MSINSTGTLKTVSARCVDVLFVSCLFFKFQFSVSVSFIFLHYFPRKDVGVGRLCPKQGLTLVKIFEGSSRILKDLHEDL